MFTHIDPIKIRRIKKEYFNGTHRVLDPKKTFEKIRPLMADIGVTEVEDITHLDRLNIPVYSAIRPGARMSDQGPRRQGDAPHPCRSLGDDGSHREVLGGIQR